MNDGSRGGHTAHRRYETTFKSNAVIEQMLHKPRDTPGAGDRLITIQRTERDDDIAGKQWDRDTSDRIEFCRTR